MMERTLLVLIAISFATGASHLTAQASRDPLRQSSPVERADLQTTWMTDTLGLNDDQQAKIQVILDSDDRRLKKARQLRQLSQQKDDELKAIFTPTQYEHYQKTKKEMRETINANKPWYSPTVPCRRGSPARVTSAAPWWKARWWMA